MTDVYEFEPNGVGGCAGSASSGSVVFKPARAFVSEAEGVRLAGEEPAGCVALMSAGSSAQESVFLDASQSGSDVFFLTTSKLAPQDFDNARDVYDAHECTAESPCLPEPAAAPAACETEASCKASPSPQPLIYGPPGSATFSGPGNPLPTLVASLTPEQVRLKRLAAALRACRAKHNRHRRAVCERQAHRRYAKAHKSSKAR